MAYLTDWKKKIPRTKGISEEDALTGVRDLDSWVDVGRQGFFV